MQSFATFLKEEADSKLKHIHHAEDRPLIHGNDGFDHAIGSLQQAHDHIKSGGKSSALTMKYDGSPSIVFGHDPENGKFFVASKSAFNKNPKINYNHEDIAKNHGHAPGLMDKLHAALTHFKKVSPKQGVYQGDMMFSGDDVEHKPRGASFTPNTITYTAKGDMADKIKKAKAGVIVHTQYHGDNLKDMKADSNPDIHNFSQHPDVFHQGVEHDTRQVHYSHEDQKAFQDHIDKAQAIHAKNPQMYDATSQHQGDGNHLTAYINHTVKNDEKPSSEGLSKFIQGKYQKEADKLSTAAGKSRRMNQGQAHVDHITSNQDHYNNMFQMHGHLQNAKDILVKNLNQHTGGLEHHIDNKPTDPEGFVVNHRGQPTKLVNRAEFSKANLLKVRK